MPNGLAPQPNDLRIEITGTPGAPASWRTAPLPRTHTHDAGYRVTDADAARIREIVAQLLDPLLLPGTAESGPPEAAPLGAHQNFPVQGDPVPQGTIQRGGPPGS